MKLREFKYMNKPARSTVNNSSSSGSYKKRFEKLIKYHIDHASSELESITHKDIKDDSFHLDEHYNTGKSEFDREIKVSYNIKNNTFAFSIRIDNILVDNKTVDSYENFVKAIEPYMFLPDGGTPDYDELISESLLREFKYMNPPKSASQSASSKTNKEKFTELVAYMQKHKDSSVIFTSVNGPNDTGFEYEEQRAFANGDEYNLSLEVECKSGNLFFIHLDMDGKRIAAKSAVGWEDLLLKIKTHFHVPKTGSPEHKSLTESVLNEWEYMNPPKNSQPASSTPSQKYRYERLLAQIDADGIATYKVNELTDLTLDITLDTYKKKNLNIKIIYKPATDDYSLQVCGRVVNGWDYEKEILELFIVGNIIYSTDLCESSASFAADFKLYENLF